MKKLILSSLMLAWTLIAFGQEWAVDAGHSRLGFSVFHNSLAEFHGNFTNYQATITQTGKTFEGAKINVTIETGSINTGIEGRDNHIKSGDFFDAEKYPTITFVSKAWEKTGENTYKVTGDLTMKGATKPVTLTAEKTGEGVNHRSNKNMVGFKITGKFNRSDFNLGGNFGGIGEEVTLLAFGEFAEK